MTLFPSATFWSVDDVSLQTLAMNIQTLAGRLKVAPLRGSDIIVPGRKGAIWTPKVADSRVLTFMMWVRGTDANGSPGISPSDTFDDNWRTIQQLLWTPGRQFRLTKRFRVGGVTKVATAMAEFNGGLEPTMIGRHAAKTSVDLKLADPYFYDDTQTVVTLANGHQDLTIAGSAETSNIEVVINGSRNNASIYNLSTGAYVEYHDSISSGAVAQLKVEDFQAFTTPSGGTQYEYTAKVISTGTVDWLTLKPGINDIQLQSTSGAGVVQLKYRGAWL